MLALEMRTDDDYDPSDRGIALWLAGPMPGKEELASQFVRIFLLWTRAAREQLDKRNIQESYRQKDDSRGNPSVDEIISRQIEEIIQEGERAKWD